ncbi:reverse transcriptase [Hypericibacter adhaerens]|uniref:Reverse transcriptase n=1 Tax=Hypericibacter adhaerens TaxID=2602016 RepID=A0A5J6MTK6_9PROT|nr:RNA-directed DNA polymerase [Hypericibacter adhaerens]QEX20573.1 reverse transcriptase [Hypericibacter adhaerens]
MEKFFKRAIANVTRHGDTDIFPFPVENHVFFDLPNETEKLLKNLHSDFPQWLASHPPAHEGALVPVSYTGFRWATQLDPIWNLYFLALVLSIADAIESQRIPATEQCVFSYRYFWNDKAATIFDANYNWRAFMERSLEKAKKHPFVVICDISEFYSRIGHHRLDNALLHLNLSSDTPTRLMKFLGNFSNTNSFGIPIGGPAARILSELVLNQVDQLLKLEGVPFCRFSDDYHLFAESMEDGFAKLLQLTEKLQRTQGLQIQKAKTRIMSSAEFISTSPVRLDDHDAPALSGTGSSIGDQARSLLRFSIRFDPYSPTADKDYEELKSEISKFDIIGLLQAELSKSRIHIALAKKIVSAIQFLAPKQRDQAVLSLLDNADLLYPIFPATLTVIRQVYSDLSESTQLAVIERLLKLLHMGSHVLRVELVLAYAVRVLALHPSSGVQAALVKLYNNPVYTPLVRRDIILAMTRLGGWHWLSERRLSFRSMSPAERRAFIIASHTLKDEGGHWRRHLSSEFHPFEQLVADWIAAKAKQPDWTVPL